MKEKEEEGKRNDKRAEKQKGFENNRRKGMAAVTDSKGMKQKMREGSKYERNHFPQENKLAHALKGKLNAIMKLSLTCNNDNKTSH
jgi:hypothetical protein